MIKIYIFCNLSHDIGNFCSSPFNPKQEFGINFKSLNINLPKLKLYVSKKDKKLPNLNKILKNSK